MHANHSSLTHTFFDYYRQIIQMHITDIAFPSDAGNSHFGLVHIFTGHARTKKHS